MRIRLLVCWILCSCLLTIAYGQRPRFRPQVHEVNVQLFSANHVPEYQDAYPSSMALSFSALNGIRYKRHLDANQAIRGGLGYRTSRYENPTGASKEFSDYTAQKLDLDLRLGYEYAFNMYRFQIYVGAEGIFNHTRLKETGTDLTDLAVERTDNYWSYGGAAILGLRFFLNTNWSLSLENEWYYLANNRQDTGQDAAFVMFPGKEVGFNVLSVQIAYHFKRMRKSCTCGKPGS